jgi:hypothetical protein
MTVLIMANSPQLEVIRSNEFKIWAKARRQCVFQ